MSSPDSPNVKGSDAGCVGEVIARACVCLRSFLVPRCEQCNCDPVGGFNGSCLAETGQCLCKLFVTGDKCDACVEGASHMDPANQLGCSKGQNSYSLHIIHKNDIRYVKG